MRDNSTPKLSRGEWVDQEQGKHFCSCNCGRVIPIKPWHHSAGIPDFIRGHMPTENRYAGGRPGVVKPELHEIRQCECGCGEEVKGKKDGKLKRFRQGHWAKLNGDRISEWNSGRPSHRALPIGSRRIECTRIGLPYMYVKCEDGEWRAEHRVVLETKLGRKLGPSEHSHHLNHDTLDNRPENVVALEHSTHSKLHCPFANAPKRILVDGELVEVDGE